MRPRTILLIAASLLILAGGLAAWLGSPRVVSVTPSPGSQGLPADTLVHLVFSQPMRPESLEERLKIEPETPGQITWTGQDLAFIPDQPWPAGGTITVTLSSGVRAAGGLGLPVLGSTSWSFTISEKLLAYLWPASDQADLYTLNPQNGKITRLTENVAVHDYTVSPVGRAIYYTVDRPSGESQIVRLLLAANGAATAPAGEVVTTCENAVCRNPAASPNGRWLAYEQVPGAGGQAQVGIWLLDMSNGGNRLASVPGHAARNPAWSSTGWLAFYDPADQAYRIIHPESGSTILMPNQIGEPGSWAPEGDLFLASESFEESTDLLVSGVSGHMWLYSLADAASVLDLTQAHYLEDTGGVFAPNGARIAFTRKYLDQERWTAGRQLWIMSLNESGPDSTAAYPLTDAPDYNHYDIAWSPDSQQIAFMRFNQAEITQLPELWLINIDGSGATQLVIGGFAPQWIP